MTEQYRNIKILTAGLDCTVDKVYPVLRAGAGWVTYIDDANEEAKLGVVSLMSGCWEPTDEEVTV